MKRAIVSLMILLGLNLWAQSKGEFGLGIAYLPQAQVEDVSGDIVTSMVGSLALDIESFYGKSFGMYASAGYGIAILASKESDAGRVDIPLNDMIMKIAMNALIGLGYRWDLSPLALTLGAGLGFDYFSLFPRDFTQEFIESMSIGPGLALKADYRLAEELSAYAGLRAVLGVYQPVFGSEFFKAAYSVVPFVGLSFKV